MDWCRGSRSVSYTHLDVYKRQDPEGLLDMNLFGTDGIRGIANHDLTCKVAFRLGRAIGSYLSPGKNICVGKDTRISGDMLEASFAAGITSTGRDVICLGVCLLYTSSPSKLFYYQYYTIKGKNKQGPDLTYGNLC